MELHLLYLIFFFSFLATPCNTWDLSSLTRDGTCAPALVGRVLTPGPPESAWSSNEAYLLLTCVCQLLSPVIFMTPWTVICQAPLSMEFSRQEYWGG